VATAIESTEGIKNLPDILRVKGIDVLFVGPCDLTRSLGVIGQVRHPRVIEKIQEIVTQGNRE
jgi:4-hydroxy-2-oxoheptanedioate aldolase